MGHRPIVSFVLASGEGILYGVVLWSIIAVGITYFVHTVLDGVAPPEETVVISTSRALALLVGFLVSNNINQTFSINTTVSDLSGACVDLALLVQTMLPTNSAKEGSELTAHVCKCLQATPCGVLEQVACHKCSGSVGVVHELVLKAFEDLKRLHASKALETGVLRIFVNLLNKISGAYTNLEHKRASVPTPAIRVAVYSTGIFNTCATLLEMQRVGQSLGSKMLVGVALTASTLGVLSTSSATRDPLDSRTQSKGLRARVQKTIHYIEGLQQQQQDTSLCCTLATTALLPKRPASVSGHGVTFKM